MLFLSNISPRVFGHVNVFFSAVFYNFLARSQWGRVFFCSWWVSSLFSDDSGRVFTRGWRFKVHGACFYGWVRYSLHL
jgi:hypothetical protein